MALSKGHINVAVELIKKDMVSEEVESSLEEALGNEAMERLRDVQDTPKEVKPPVAFYNRKKGKKNKEVYTEKGATDNNTQTEINKEN
uniref:Uncharacterized protein n=1 Tax=Babesia bovis TaxID=5865 RepID=A7AQ34_BABBO|eukprot:XP_001612236.1 hypothetical protein [Babesia bovis T2Bo]